MICIYSITNKINNKVYVGQTDNYKRRVKHHLQPLRGNYHPVKLLQEDFNKYGENIFEFNIEQECTVDTLDILEQFYIKKLNAFEDNGGYNANTGGKSGYEISQRTKNILSEKTKNNFESNPGYYNKIAEHNREMAKKPEVLERLKRNIEMTEERKLKISKTMIKVWDDEKKNQKREEMINRYTNQNEREKTSEATKAGMAKMTKEQKSRRQLCDTPIDVLIQMTKERYLTQQDMAEKFDVAVSLTRVIKSGKHWIYEYMEENDIVIDKMPEKSRFRSSVSTEVLIQIVKDKDMKMSDLYNKYQISKKILGTVKNGKHWIYEYIKENNIIL